MSEVEFGKFDQEQSQQGIAAGATVVTISLTVPAGERWEIYHASAVHNDPANPGVYWFLTRDGAARQLCDSVGLNSGVKTHLYQAVPGRENFILKAGDILGVTAVSMAAGKNWTMQAIYGIRRGETP